MLQCFRQECARGDGFSLRLISSGRSPVFCSGVNRSCALLVCVVRISMVFFVAQLVGSGAFVGPVCSCYKTVVIFVVALLSCDVGRKAFLFAGDGGVGR